MSVVLILAFLLLNNAPAFCEEIGPETEISITKTNKDQVYRRGELVFADEFDAFDLETWNHEITLGGNTEWEFQMFVNSRSNSYVRGGYLYIRPTLTSDRYGVDFVYNGQLSIEGSMPVEECTSTGNWGCYRSGNYPDLINPVMSAKIRTVDSFYFKYGRVDIRAKIPSAEWTATGLTLLPRFNAYGAWPASGLIEIMSSRGNKHLKLSNGESLGADVVISKLHYGPDYSRNGQECTQTTFQAPPGEGFDSDFHVYSVEWTDEQITFLVDNMTTRIITPPAEGFWYHGCIDNYGESPWKAAENKRMAPFDQKFFINLNIAVGGANSGLWPEDIISGTNKKKPWTKSANAYLEFYESLNEWYPSWEGDAGALMIDYIRVYAV